ncbi:NADH dehydrogenase, alpha subcomplex, subunit 6 [Mrakia frigida]|uniref:NADH dehydrogenase [ubiquinone] 1 alpha subcomplex subunit 6 n=1 Tax=Mrakia frigida TaxID=29902 RepID=UPI003FCC1D58
MTTLPSRLAKMSRSSVSPQDAAARVRTLYRDFYRAAPMVIDTYPLDMDVYDLRAKIREGFERNKHVTDTNVIDILLHKGRQEFQEAINVWKQPVHIQAWFRDSENEAKPVTFLDKFLAGRDDSGVQTFH